MSVCFDCKTTKTSKWFNKRNDKREIIGRQCRSCYRTEIEYPKEALKHGRAFGTGNPKRTINKTENICLWCKGRITQANWYRNYDIHNPRLLLNMLCHKCYDHLIHNPSIAAKEKATNRYRYYIRVESENGEVRYKEVKTNTVQRTGHCSELGCSNNVFDGSCKNTLLTMRHGIRKEICVGCFRSKQIFPIKDTVPEVKIQKGLKVLEIPFEKHKRIRINNHWHQIDIFVQPSLAIEIDGEFWHNLPENHVRDIRLERGLAGMGIKLLRFSQSEIDNNLSRCLEIISRSIEVKAEKAKARPNSL